MQNVLRAGVKFTLSYFLFLFHLVNNSLKRYWRTIALIGVLNFAGCELKIRDEIRKAETISVKMPESQDKDVNISDFVDKIDIIQLETVPGSLFGEAFDLIYQDSRFYIFDMRLQELFVFTDLGKFEYKLDHRGKGPGEYVEIRDFEIDNHGNVHVLTSGRIVIYDSLGNFKKYINLSFPSDLGSISPISLAFSPDGYALYNGTGGINNVTIGDYIIYHVDSNGVFSGKANFEVKNGMTHQPRFFKIPAEKNNQYTLTPLVGDNTVYTFSEGMFSPAYFLDFGKREMPEEIYSGLDNGKKVYDAFMSTDYVTMIGPVIITNKYLTFRFKSNKNYTVAFCSVDSGDVFYLDALGPNGVKDYFPAIILSGHESTFIGLVESISLVDCFSGGVFKEKYGFLRNYEELEKKVASIKVNDNPVMMMVTIKDF